MDNTHLPWEACGREELLCGRCLGAWSVAGTQGDKEQKEEQGCSVLART